MLHAARGDSEQASTIGSGHERMQVRDEPTCNTGDTNKDKTAKKTKNQSCTKGNVTKETWKQKNNKETEWSEMHLVSTGTKQGRSKAKGVVEDLVMFQEEILVGVQAGAQAVQQASTDV